MSRLWRPADISDSSLLILYRAWLVSLPVGMASMLVSLIAGGAALAGRPVIGGKALCVAIALGLGPVIAGSSLRLVAATRRGYVTRRGLPVRRGEQRARYWFWIGVDVLAASVPLAAASYLLWMGLAIR
jgi:hypothetical protein